MKISTIFTPIILAIITMTVPYTYPMQNALPTQLEILENAWLIELLQSSYLKALGLCIIQQQYSTGDKTLSIEAFQGMIKNISESEQMIQGFRPTYPSTTTQVNIKQIKVYLNQQKYSIALMLQDLVLRLNEEIQKGCSTHVNINDFTLAECAQGKLLTPENGFLLKIIQLNQQIIQFLLQTIKPT